MRMVQIKERKEWEVGEIRIGLMLSLQNTNENNILVSQAIYYYK